MSRIGARCQYPSGAHYAGTGGDGTAGRGARRAPRDAERPGGLGDLVLTCTGALSRNRFVGVELGKGRPLAEILGGMKMVAEGVGTAAALLALAREHNIEMPITEQVNAILYEGQVPRQRFAKSWNVRKRANKRAAGR